MWTRNNSSNNSGSSSLNNLTDVDVHSTSPSNGQVLSYSNGKWIPSTVTANGNLEDFVIGEDTILYTSPKIQSSYNRLSVLSTDSISIPYIVSDTGYGGLTAKYTIDGIPSSVSITTGSNTWNVGKLSNGGHVLQIQVSDNGGGKSNTLTFNITSWGSTNYSGIVTDGLSMFLDHPTTQNIPNPNNYLQGTNEFTIIATAIIPTNGSILSRYQLASGQNAYNIYRSSSNQFVANFYGGNLPSPSSSVFTDTSSYFHIAVIRSNTTIQGGLVGSGNITIYVNNVKDTQMQFTNASTTVTCGSSTLNAVLGSNSPSVTFKNFAIYNRALLYSERLQNYNILGV